MLVLQGAGLGYRPTRNNVEESTDSRKGFFPALTKGPGFRPRFTMKPTRNGTGHPGVEAHPPGI
jgi:hypothetical protein